MYIFTKKHLVKPLGTKMKPVPQKPLFYATVKENNKENEKMNPKCPECNHSINFLNSFRNINPWKYSCPHCKKRIEVSKNWKNATIAGFFVGIFVGIGINAMNFAFLPSFSVVMLIAVVLSWMLWQKVTFTHLEPKS